jgi:2-dehydro-3-deoxyglucarate aldolase/4-hydroxy-2-oxoheptanedioate aldolase
MMAYHMGKEWTGSPMRRVLTAGGRPIGTMVGEFATTGIARLAAAAGAEFVLLDLEHTGYSLERMRTVVAAARASEITVLVRVPDAAYDFIARTLDLGAHGVMVPSVESVDEARMIAESARFPPRGRRGFGLIHRGEWSTDGLPAMMERLDAETIVLVQIETAAGLEAVEGIAAVDGVDVLWIGHFDLTTSLGIPGEFGNPRFEHAVERVLAAGKANGKPVGILAGNADDAVRHADRGFGVIAVGLDVWLYQDALRDGIAAVRGSTSKEESRA